MTPTRTIVPLLALLSAACASVGEPPLSAPAPAPPLPPAPIATPAPAAVPAPAAAPRDTWARLAAGLAFVDCPGSPRAQRRAARYLADKAALEAQLARALPLLEHVLGETVRARLPSEFALLPLVESGYRPVPARGRGPAGYWQFMPVTARDHGLALGADYDARLDLVASTAAAVRLLQHLGRAFDGDWVLANMAFNAGEFRVKRALSLQPGPDRLHDALALPAITHEHTARLVALVCLTTTPGALRLPAAGTGSARYVHVPAPAALRLAEIDALAPGQQLATLNAAVRDGQIEAGQPIVVPATLAPALAARLAALPPAPTPALAQTDHAAPRSDATHYVVRRGDSLWLIARRLGLPLGLLRSLNGYGTATPLLRPGQRLRIAP